MSGKSSFRKAWEVLLPYLLYYLTYQVSYLILAFAYQASVSRFGGAYGQFMTAHAAAAAGAMGGLCMLIGILPLVPMLREELRKRGEVDKKPLRKISMAALTVFLALSASLGLNALLTLTGFADSSQTYQEVAGRQYGVPFAMGFVLYGMISPLVEEVVFRGVIYNRLRRFYGSLVGIVVSGIFFGAFHGNLVQGVYGACLGMLMAYLYERSDSFGIPILFHAVANLAVYTTARMEGVQEILFTPGCCAVLLTVSAVCVLAERRLRKVSSAKRG